MVLFYTGADTSDKPQPDPNLSLGGRVSNTPIANGRLGNLFPALTQSTVSQDRHEIRMIALKNTLTVPVTNLRLWTDMGTSSCKLQIAAVGPAIDECGNPVFEQVYDDSAIPFQAVLDYHEGEVNAISVGVLNPGNVIGIWIRREVDPSKFPPPPGPSATLTCVQRADLLQQANAAQDETMQLIIDWAQ